MVSIEIVSRKMLFAYCVLVPGRRCFRAIDCRSVHLRLYHIRRRSHFFESIDSTKQVLDPRNNPANILGTGTFGRVYLVKERRTCEFFALKTLRIADVLKLKQIDHVLNEKKTLKKARHPFIITL